MYITGICLTFKSSCPTTWPERISGIKQKQQTHQKGINKKERFGFVDYPSRAQNKNPTSGITHLTRPNLSLSLFVFFL